MTAIEWLMCTLIPHWYFYVLCTQGIYNFVSKVKNEIQCVNSFKILQDLNEYFSFGNDKIHRYKLSTTKIIQNESW